MVVAHPTPHESPVNSMALVRCIRRMACAGFTLTIQNNRLEVSPFGLSEDQRAFIRQHKAALVALLNDVEILHGALVAAGVVGLAWQEGTPVEWRDERLLAVCELLYDRRLIVYRHGRHYASA